MDNNGAGADKRSLAYAPIRTPRSAAVAGIAFSLLTATSMVLAARIVSVAPGGIDADLLAGVAERTQLAIALVPFAGIAFLWFTGVIRDLLGDREDQFFATVFLGSGLIFVALLFVWATIIGAVFGTFALFSREIAGKEIYIFGFQLMNEIMNNFILRMAAVYMLSIGTLWNRTHIMPRWLIIITYIVALVFLVFAGVIQTLRFVFPGWVLLVSVYILIAFRRSIGSPSRSAGAGE